MSNCPIDPSAETSAELEVPAEIRRSSAASAPTTGCLLAAILVLLPAVAYFGFFGLILLDELVLGTHYLDPGNIPQPVFDGLVIIYAPLIYLTRWALGIQ